MNWLDVSIVTCSIDDARFRSLEKNLNEIFGRHAQIVRIKGAKSMAEGYNRGAQMAAGGIVIFCHDDIEILNRNVPEIIAEDLNVYDIVGVAGTSRLLEGRWHSAGSKYVHGQVAHSRDGRRNEYQICVYGERRHNPVISHIQALDGLFLAVRRNVLESVRFDEAFNGFHLYDLDFTFSAYLMGFRLAVDYRIHLLHHSGGRYDRIWKEFFHRFNQKHEKLLKINKTNMASAIQRFALPSKESLDLVMHHLETSARCQEIDR